MLSVTTGAVLTVRYRENQPPSTKIPSMAKYNISPSRIARYYFHECDRYLRYTATPGPRKTEEGVPQHDLDFSLVTRPFSGVATTGKNGSWTST